MGYLNYKMGIDQTAEQSTEVAEKTKAPEFSLPPAPKNQREVLSRIMEDEARLKIKAESIKEPGQTEQAKQVALEGDMQHRIGDHLVEIGRGYVREELGRLFPEFDYDSDESSWTPEQKEAMEWAVSHASDMPISALTKRAENYRTNLETDFKQKNEQAGMKDLGLNQVRDLHAADSLVSLLKTYQPKDAKG